MILPRLHLSTRIRESWDRYLAALLTAIAGFWAALHPSPAFDLLVGGFPATWLFGVTLGIGASMNLIGLANGSYGLQRIGLIAQIPPLLLFGLALVILSPMGFAYGLLLIVLAARVHRQRRLLVTAKIITTAVITRATTEDP